MKRKFPGMQWIPIFALIFLAVVLVTAFGSKTITVMSDSSPQVRQHCIIIDAGHGGVDGGATSCTGILESQLNLQIALRLNDLLHLLGYRTDMIRTQDISVYTEGTTIATKKISDLKERVRIVNSTENAILLSIHQNYFSDGRYSGAQVFYAANPESETMAKMLQKAIVTTLNLGSNRQAKPSSGVYLMERIHCPGVLIECGFLSNVEEEALLRSVEYQKKLCCVIVTSTASFLNS